MTPRYVAIVRVDTLVPHTPVVPPGHDAMSANGAGYWAMQMFVCSRWLTLHHTLLQQAIESKIYTFPCSNLLKQIPRPPRNR